MRIYPDDILMINFFSAKIEFDNYNDANLCIDSINKIKEEHGIMTSIDYRNMCHAEEW